MKEYVITVDGGTTNTRVALWNLKKELLSFEKLEIGAKDTEADGNNIRLKNAVKGMIGTVMESRNIAYEDVDSIYACGMLTSNVGIKEIPHLSAPADLTDYVQGVKDILIPEIAPVPISFIPGMKNLSGNVEASQLEIMDIMRGEETEVLALMELCMAKSVLFVLPGSHTKFVSVNKDGRMTGCLTSMAGELLSLLTKHSILAETVEKQFSEKDYDKEMLMLGAELTWKTGLSRAAFLTRISKQFLELDARRCADFLLGTVLAEDISAVKRSSALKISDNTEVIIAGKEPLKSAMLDLFIKDGTFGKVHGYNLERDMPLSGYGMCVVAEHRRRQREENGYE